METKRGICRHYSYSQGCCSPVKFINGKEEYQDVSECPVVKSGHLCENFTYYGDIFGDIDGNLNWQKRLTNKKNEETGGNEMEDIASDSYSTTFDIDLPIPLEKTTRKRYVELTRMAKEICDLMEKRGVKRGEGCLFKRIAMDMWTLEKQGGVKND